METTLNAEPERLGHWSTEISVLTGEVENLRGRVAELSAQKDQLQAHNSELVMRAQEADQKARCLHGAEERAHRAEAVTIAVPAPGFRGWRYRWWRREHEVPFPEWRTP